MLLAFQKNSEARRHKEAVDRLTNQLWLHPRIAAVSLVVFASALGVRDHFPPRVKVARLCNYYLLQSQKQLLQRNLPVLPPQFPDWVNQQKNLWSPHPSNHVSLAVLAYQNVVESSQVLEACQEKVELERRYWIHLDKTGSRSRSIN